MRQNPAAVVIEYNVYLMVKKSNQLFFSFEGFMKWDNFQLIKGFFHFHNASEVVKVLWMQEVYRQEVLLSVDLLLNFGARYYLSWRMYSDITVCIISPKVCFFCIDMFSYKQERDVNRYIQIQQFHPCQRHLGKAGRSDRKVWGGESCRFDPQDSESRISDIQSWRILEARYVEGIWILM